MIQTSVFNTTYTIQIHVNCPNYKVICFGQQKRSIMGRSLLGQLVITKISNLKEGKEFNKNKNFNEIYVFMTLLFFSILYIQTSIKTYEIEL